MIHLKHQFVSTLVKDPEHVKDGDEHFCACLVPQLRRLAVRDNQLAKIKIQQLLFDIEFWDLIFTFNLSSDF